MTLETGPLVQVLRGVLPREASDQLCRKVAERIIASGVLADVRRDDYRLALLRAVASYDEVNQSDLPLPLLDSIRSEVASMPAEATR